MEKQPENYNISFFKPTTELARKNRNLAIKLILIWFIGTFGFQFLLRIMEEPTPEPSYLTFEQVWEDVRTGNSNLEQDQDFLNSSLDVLGKLLISNEDRLVLDKAVSSAFWELLPVEDREAFVTKVSRFNEIKDEVKSLDDEEYVMLKRDIIQRAAGVLNIEKHSLEAQLIPFELIASGMEPWNGSEHAGVPAIMAKYLIHNQSVLTDFRFLGFPFHYFYTAVFLLILFVGICWYYCMRIDRVHKQLGIQEIIEQ